MALLEDGGRGVHLHIVHLLGRKAGAGRVQKFLAAPALAGVQLLEGFHGLVIAAHLHIHGRFLPQVERYHIAVLLGQVTLAAELGDDSVCQLCCLVDLTGSSQLLHLRQRPHRVLRLAEHRRRERQCRKRECCAEFHCLRLVVAVKNCRLCLFREKRRGATALCRLLPSLKLCVLRGRGGYFSGHCKPTV